MLISVSGRYILIAIGILNALIIARLLTPADFGRFSIAVSIIAISSSLRELGISSYLIRIPQLDQAALGRGFAVTMTASLMVGLPIFLARDFFAGFFGEPEIAPLVGLLCANFLIIPPGMGASASLYRQMRFGALNLMLIVTSVMAAVVAIALAATGHGPMSLAIGQVTQYALQLLWFMVIEPRSVFVRPHFRGAREMLRFGVPSTLSGVVNQGGMYATSIVLGRLLGPAAVGFFERGSGLFSIMNNDLVGAIAQVLFVGIARVREQREALAQLFRRSLRILTATIWPAYGVVAALSAPLIELMFGPQWRPATEVLQVLCLAGMISAGYIIYQRLVVAVGAMGRMLAIESAGQGTRLLAAYLLAGFGLGAAAFGTVISMALLGVLYLLAARAYLSADRRVVVMIYLESLLITALTAAPAAAVVAYGPQDLPPFFILAIGGTLSLAAWLSTILLLRHDVADELRDLLSAAIAWRRGTFTRPAPSAKNGGDQGDTP
ncbi:MAG: oligosaccharide flippase family protein [Alphaproteobacteria bacterium]|nr:oligosaccharide flippase family protein [Alphaproteobacteria bacterium]